MSYDDKDILESQSEVIRDLTEDILELQEACRLSLIAFKSSKHVLEYVHPDTAKEFTDAWTAVEKALGIEPEKQS